MNERILELAKQADPGYTGNSEDDMGEAIVGNDAIEKFAELIVRECHTRMEQYINDCGEVASIPDTLILEHFGFKEC